MSVNRKIIAALEPLNIPVVPDVYDGEAATYCVFQYSVIPVDFGDDDSGHERYLIQVHLFCLMEENSLGLRRKIRRLLSGAGFTRPDEVNATNTAEDKDKRKQHFVFECETVEGVDHGEAVDQWL